MPLLTAPERRPGKAGMPLSIIAGRNGTARKDRPEDALNSSAGAQVQRGDECPLLKTSAKLCNSNDITKRNFSSTKPFAGRKIALTHVGGVWRTR